MPAVDHPLVLLRATRLQRQPEREASPSEEGAGAAVETQPTAELVIKPTSKAQDKIPAKNETEKKPGKKTGKKAKRAQKAKKNAQKSTEKNAKDTKIGQFSVISCQ